MVDNEATPHLLGESVWLPRPKFDQIPRRITGPCGAAYGDDGGPSPGSDRQTRVSPDTPGTPRPRMTALSSALRRAASAARRCSGPTVAARI